ncbi:hypothetical protein Syun_014039 [Stephania yunnanensis]|uniref:PIPK domain-containing protein n=1 Tax=Stephania yunnanensis TaxID=152371 RepID=A0AAP0P968_9MAGN
MLPDYHHHVRTYDNSLITKFFGLHRIKPSSGQKTLERICSWALFSSLFGSGLLGRNPVNMHYHWLLSSYGESEVLQSCVIVIIWSPYCSSYSDQSCWSFGDWSC